MGRGWAGVSRGREGRGNYGWDVICERRKKENSIFRALTYFFLNWVICFLKLF